MHVSKYHLPKIKTVVPLILHSLEDRGHCGQTADESEGAALRRGSSRKDAFASGQGTGLKATTSLHRVIKTTNIGVKQVNHISNLVLKNGLKCRVLPK